MLVKGFLSHKVAHARPQMRNFLDILSGTIKGNGIMNRTSLRCGSSSSSFLDGSLIVPFLDHHLTSGLSSAFSAVILVSKFLLF